MLQVKFPYHPFSITRSVDDTDAILMSPTWSLCLRMPDSNPIFVASSMRVHSPPTSFLFCRPTILATAHISSVRRYLIRPDFPGTVPTFSGGLNSSVPASHKIRFEKSKCPAFLQVIKISGVPRGVWGVQTPPPEILKAFQNHAKLNPIVKTVKNC